MFAIYTCVSLSWLVASSVTNTTATLISPNVISELYNITVTCTIHPESEADLCEVRAMDDGGETRTGTCTFMYIHYIAIATVSG